MIAPAAVMAVFDTMGARAHVDPSLRRTLAVTSAIRREGVSTVALGTALSFAAFDSTASVLLIDANWIHASITEAAGRTTARGLADCLRDGHPLDRAVHATQRRGLYLLPAGESADETPPLGRLAAILETARRDFARIVVDLPPLMVVPSLVTPWADLADQTYLVVRRGATPVTLIRKAIAQLSSDRPPQIILNRSHERTDSWRRVA